MGQTCDETSKSPEFEPFRIEKTKPEIGFLEQMLEAWIVPQFILYLIYSKVFV